MEEETKKQFWQFAFMVVVGVLVITVIYLLTLLNAEQSTITIDKDGNKMLLGNSANQLKWNGTILTDRTIYNGSACYGEYFGMRVEVNPCIAQDFNGDDIRQDVKFKWTGAQTRNITWIFVYDNQLEKGSISALINHSVIEQQNVNVYVNNYLVDAVQSYTDLITPPERCDLGNLNNTLFYSVTRTRVNETYTQIICFSSRTVVNATSFRISGNTDVLGNVQTTRKEYVDVSNHITNLGVGLLGDNDTRHYFKTREIEFSPGETLDTAWSYTPFNKTKIGKWHILGYEKEYGLINSIKDNRYLYLDPWWGNSTAWSVKKTINFTTTTAINNYSIKINVTYDADMNADFSDLRFIDETGTIEIPYWMEAMYPSSSAEVWIKVDTSAGVTKYVDMYYKNPTALNIGNISNAFLKGDEFSQTLDTTQWLAAQTSAGSCTSASVAGYLNITCSASARAVTSNQSYSLPLEAVSSFQYTITGTHYDNPQFGFHRLPLGSGARGIVNTGNYTIMVDGNGGDANYANWFRMQFGPTIQYLNKYSMTPPKQRYSIFRNLTAAAFQGNGSRMFNNTVTIEDQPYNIGFEATAGQTYTQMSIDYFFLRRTTPSGIDPTVFVGAEETLSFNPNIDITIFYPANNFITNNNLIRFNFTLVPTNINITNWTVTVWNLSDYIVSEVFPDGNIFTNESYNVVANTTLTGGSYKWGIKACGGALGTSCNYSTNRTLSIHVIPPNLTLISPVRNLSTINGTSTINLTYIASDEFLDSCWYNSTINTTISYITCNSSVSIPVIVNYTNRPLTINYYSNDTFGSLSSGEAKVYVYYVIPTANVSQPKAVEGEIFTTYLQLNMTNITAHDVSAYFVYNGQNYSSPVKNTLSDDIIYFNQSVVAVNPGVLSSNINWTWFYSIDPNGGDVNITNYNISSSHNVSSMVLSLCNSSVSKNVLNVTFRDESGLIAKMNATMDLASFSYRHGNSDNHTYTFTNTTHNYEYDFCIYPIYTPGTVYVEYELSYSNSETGTYPQRKNFYNETFINSSVTNKVLYLLNYNNGLTSTYNVVTIGNQVISDVFVTVSRNVGGTNVEISNGYTDDAGSISFFLNPNYDHVFTFSKSGYTTLTQTIKPTQTTYTITMGTSTNYFYYTYPLEGISYVIWPPSGIIQSGMYNYTFKVYSRSSNIKNCSFYIYRGNGTLLNSSVACNLTGSFTNGGTANVWINTSGVDTLYGQYFITLSNGTYKIEGDAQWKNVNISSKNFGRSIRTAINDSINLPEWGDDPQTNDFSRIVFFFLGLAIVLAMLNFYTGYDTAYPGAFLYVVTAVVILMSAINGFSGPGFFYLDVVQITTTATPHSFFGGFERIINNWILPAHFLLLSGIYFFTTQKRYQAG